MSKKILFLIVFPCVLTLLLGGIALAAEEADWMRGREPEKFGGTLTLARGREPNTLDSLLTNYGDQAHIYLSEPPFMYSPDGDFGPSGWIDSITQSDDNLVWRFELKKGVTFHDGVPLDAEAFAWLLRKRIRDDSVYSYPLTNVPDPEHIVVVDEHTLEIRQTEKAFPELPFNMATPSWLGAIRTPNAVEKYGDDYGQKEAYGNGPFKLEEFVKGDHITFVRNEDYWWSPEWADDYAGLKEGEEYHHGPPYLEEVVLEYVPEASTRISMFKTGEVDGIVEVPALNIDEIKAMSGVEILESPSYVLRLVEYNTTVDFLDDIKVRKALNYGVNRQAIIDVVYSGYAEPAYSPYCGSALETEDTLKLYEYDPGKAAELLSEAGWKMGEDDFRVKDGEQLSFEFWSSNETEFKMIAEMVQGMWQSLGVNAELRTFDEATLRARIEKGEHEAVLFQHEWVTKGDMYNWWFAPESKWYPQKTGFDTPELRELVNKTYEAETVEDINQTTDDLVNYYYENAVVNAILRPSNIMAVHDNVKNVFMSHREGGWWGYMPRLWDVYLQDVYEGNKAE